MVKTTWKAQLGRVLLVAVVASVSGGCGADLSGGDAEDVGTDRVKGEPPGLTEADIANATFLNLEPGVSWEMRAREEATMDEDTPELDPQTLTTISAKSWAPLSTGQWETVSFSLSSTESLAAYVHPYNEVGDIDLYLYKWNPATLSWNFVKSSVNVSGYFDLIFTPPYVSGWEGQYYLQMYCFMGPCSFGSYITKGDDQDFHTQSVYLNQRSFTTNTNSCKNDSNVWVADGECMCADASAAMALVADGKRKISQLASSAQDLFDNTNEANGAANRWALMNRLKANYGYTNCSDLTLNESNIRYYLRYKWLVLLRSPKFSSAGHYVQLRGYKTESGVFKVRVNDPYGVWSSKNVWSPKNTTSAGYGNDTVIQLSLLKDPSASLVVCK
jgi:hypothetical protein